MSKMSIIIEGSLNTPKKYPHHLSWSEVKNDHHHWGCVKTQKVMLIIIELNILRQYTLRSIRVLTMLFVEIEIIPLRQSIFKCDCICFRIVIKLLLLSRNEHGIHSLLIIFCNCDTISKLCKLKSLLICFIFLFAFSSTLLLFCSTIFTLSD